MKGKIDTEVYTISQGLCLVKEAFARWYNKAMSTPFFAPLRINRAQCVGLAYCVLLFLSACAVDHLKPQSPWPLLTPGEKPHSMNRLLFKEILANRLKLSWGQRRDFYALLDHVQSQHQALGPLVSRYQVLVRRSFENPQFRRDYLLTRWEAIEAPYRKRMAQASQKEFVKFWQQLKPAQRKLLQYQVSRFGARWSALAQPLWRDIPAAQAQQLKRLQGELGLSTKQYQALVGTLEKADGYQFWAPQIAASSQEWKALLHKQDFSKAELQQALEKTYQNRAYIKMRLNKLAHLHHHLSPRQRKQLLLKLKKF